MSIISLLVALVLVCVVYWAVTRILAAFGVGDPIATVVQVVLVVLILLWVLSQFSGVGPTLNLR